MKSDFLLAITQLAAERNLPRDMVFKAVEEALLSAYRKDDILGEHDISVRVLAGSGEIKVYAHKNVVETLEDPLNEITLGDAKKIRKDAQMGEAVDVEIEPPDAGRIGVQTAKQVVMQRLRDAEREFIFGTFAHQENDILSGVVQQVGARQIVVDLGKAEGLLPAVEQVRTEHYRIGQRLKVYLLEVSQTPKGPRLLLSRSHPNLVWRLFDLEVPEIGDGLVEVKAIAREPGLRTKIAVAERQPGLDPVGSCIGLRGIRIQNIINELQGEKIDVVQWHTDPKAFIASALSPAQVLDVTTDLSEMMASVVVPDGQLSLAIGKEGQNVRLAAKLTSWRIDIKSSQVAEEERIALAAETISLTEPIEQVEEAVKEGVVEQAEEEVIPIEAVLEEPVLRTVDGVHIRFAEDILPDSVRAPATGVKSKKKTDKKQKGGSPKRIRTLSYEDEFDEDGVELELDDPDEHEHEDGVEDGVEDDI